MESQFLTMDLHRVMALDSTVNSHPIVQEVAHPDQITEIFDTISYAKGASVLRMLEQFMGEELFREGVHVFLERFSIYQKDIQLGIYIIIIIIMTIIIRFKYGNAVTNDLWTALSEVAQGRLDIKAIMDTWTRQMGYPVLQVKIKSPPELPWFKAT